MRIYVLEVCFLCVSLQRLLLGLVVRPWMFLGSFVNRGVIIIAVYTVVIQGNLDVIFMIDLQKLF